MKTKSLVVALAATSMMLAMSSCSSNEEITEQPAAAYVWGTDGSIKTCDHLTLGSVGAGTQIDHVQVSYTNDDSFEWFGGNVDCRYLVAFNGWHDEFDTDNGYSGRVQYALSIRDPRIADTSQSNGFESDNDADGSLTEPFTSAVFSNVTFC